MIRNLAGRLRPSAFAILVAVGGCEREEGTKRAVPPPPPTPADTSGPDLSLEGLGHTRGASDAPVIVVEFSDFGCPYCAQFAGEVYPRLAREFIETGEVRWRFVPFILGSFPNGDAAAVAAECASEQDAFWEMHDLLFERQREWKSSSAPGAVFPGYARSLGLDLTRFTACTDAPAAAARVRLSTETAEGLGVRATPSFLVNGRPVQGALPLEQFRMLLQWAGAGGARDR